MLKASDDGGVCRFFLTMLGFHPLWVERSFGDRYMTRAREIAAMDEAQRILSGEYGQSSSRLWISLAQCFLSRARRIEFWAEEKRLLLQARHNMCCFDLS